MAISTPVILQPLDPAAGADSTPVVRELHVDRASGLVDLFPLLGFLMGVWLVPRVGAIRMRVGGFVGTTAGMLLPAWASGLPAIESGRAQVVILGFVLFRPREAAASAAQRRAGPKPTPGRAGAAALAPLGLAAR